MAKFHLRRRPIPKQKIAVTLDSDLLAKVDQLVAVREFPNRSQAIEAALADAIERNVRTRLARECARLDPAEESALAEEGLLAEGAEWPAY